MTISVHRVSPDDVAELVELAAAHGAALAPGFVPPVDTAQWSGALADPATWWYTIRDSTGVVAIAVLARVTGPPWRSAEVGVGVMPPARGRGIGTAVLRTVFERELGPAIVRIEALIDPDNSASMRMVAAAGMAFEGISRSVLAFGERRADLARWAIVEEPSPQKGAVR